MSIFTFRPVENGPDPLAEFRAMCREMGGSSLVEPIRKITAVGAAYTKNGLSDGDKIYLRAALETCQDLSIPVSDQFTLTPLNIAYSADQDFLNPKLAVPADLILLCFVFNPPKLIAEKFMREDAVWYARLSPRHFREGAWLDAAKRAGAKVIIPFAAGLEVDVDYLMRGCSGKGGAFSAIKMPAREILMRRQFLQEMAIRGGDPEPMIGRAAERYCARDAGDALSRAAGRRASRVARFFARLAR